MAATAVAAAILARGFLLLVRPLWHDELFTIWAARMPASGLLAVLRQDSGPPLFYWLEKPLTLLGEAIGSDRIARLLPFAATLLLFAVAARLDHSSRREWLLALLACSPLLLVYAAEARPYALLALLDFALFLLLFRGKPALPRLAAGAAAAALVLWTHYLAIFFLAAAALLLAARRRWRSLLALAAGGISFLAWRPVLLEQPREATAWMLESLVPSVSGLFAALGGTGRIPTPLAGPLPSPLFWSGAAIGVLLLFSVAREARRGHDRESIDAILLTVATIGLVVIASFIRPVSFPGRSEMAVLPIWLWAASHAASENTLARLAALAAVALAGVSSLILIAAPRPEPVASQAVRLVVGVAHKEDLVIAAGAFYLPARLARDRGELEAPLAAFPSNLALHPGWVSVRPPTDADYGVLDATLSNLAPGRQAFVLLPPVVQGPRLDRLLAARGTVRTLMAGSHALILLCTVGQGVPASPIPDRMGLGPFLAIARSDIP